MGDREKFTKRLFAKPYCALSTQTVDNCVDDLCRLPSNARPHAGRHHRPKSRQAGKLIFFKDLQTLPGCQEIGTKKVPLRQNCA
jgi:hypothetical protein